MTVQEIMQRLEAMNADIAVFRHSRISGKGHWSVLLEVTDDGTIVKTQQCGDTYDEALAAAWQRFDRATSKGLDLRRLAAPTIEHGA